MRGRFQLLLISILFFLLISNTQSYSKKPLDVIVQPHHSKNPIRSIQNSYIAQVEDLEGPSFGYSWEFFLNNTIGFVVTTGGSNYTYSKTFSNYAYDQSGIDTILLYYYVGSISEWYLNKDQILEQVSWIQCDTVSYDVHTNRCSTTLYFNPPIINDPIFAFYWANDTLGHESRGGLQCYHYSGMNPFIHPYFHHPDFLPLFSIGTACVLVITCIIIKKKSNVTNS